MIPMNKYGFSYGLNLASFKDSEIYLAGTSWNRQNKEMNCNGQFFLPSLLWPLIWPQLNPYTKGCRSGRKKQIERLYYDDLDTYRVEYIEREFPSYLHYM